MEVTMTLWLVLHKYRYEFMVRQCDLTQCVALYKALY